MVSCSLKPEGIFEWVQVFRGTKERSGKGRMTQGEGILVGEFRGILAQAVASEKERWRQLTHPVTHKIIQKNLPDFTVEVGDVFSTGTQEFIVSAVPYNVANLGQWVIYYCQERRDL